MSTDPQQTPNAEAGVAKKKQKAQVPKENQKNPEPATEQEQANASASPPPVSEAPKDPQPKQTPNAEAGAKKKQQKAGAKKKQQKAQVPKAKNSEPATGQEQANASASPSPVSEPRKENDTVSKAQKPAATTTPPAAFVRRSKRSAAAAQRVTTGGVANCFHCKRLCNYGHDCPGCKRIFHVICMLSINQGRTKMCIPCFEKRKGQVKELDSHDVDQWSPGVFKPYHPFTKRYALKKLNMQVHKLT